MSGKKQSGLPPFYDDLCKLVGVEDKAGAQAAPPEDEKMKLPADVLAAQKAVLDEQLAAVKMHQQDTMLLAKAMGETYDSELVKAIESQPMKNQDGMQLPTVIDCTSCGFTHDINKSCGPDGVPITGLKHVGAEYIKEKLAEKGFALNLDELKEYAKKIDMPVVFATQKAPELKILKGLSATKIDIDESQNPCKEIFLDDYSPFELKVAGLVAEPKMYSAGELTEAGFKQKLLKWMGAVSKYGLDVLAKYKTAQIDDILTKLTPEEVAKAKALLDPAKMKWLKPPDGIVKPHLIKGSKWSMPKFEHKFVDLLQLEQTLGTEFGQELVKWAQLHGVDVDKQTIPSPSGFHIEKTHDALVITIDTEGSFVDQLKKNPSIYAKYFPNHTPPGTKPTEAQVKHLGDCIGMLNEKFGWSIEHDKEKNEAFVTGPGGKKLPLPKGVVKAMSFGAMYGASGTTIANALGEHLKTPTPDGALEFKQEFMLDWKGDPDGSWIQTVKDPPYSKLGAKVTFVEPTAFDNILGEIWLKGSINDPFGHNMELVGFGKKFMLSTKEMLDQPNVVQYIINRMEELFASDLKNCGDVGLFTGDVTMAKVGYHLIWHPIVKTFGCKVCKSAGESPKSTSETSLLQLKVRREQIEESIDLLEKEFTKPNLPTMKKLALQNAIAGWKKKLKKLDIEITALEKPNPHLAGQGFLNPTIGIDWAQPLKGETFGPLKPMEEPEPFYAPAGISFSDIDKQLLELNNGKFTEDNFTLDGLFELQKFAIHLLKKKASAIDLSKWLTERTPVCCPYATPDDCTSYSALNSYFEHMRQGHFVHKHGQGNNKTLSGEDVIGLLSDVWTKLKKGYFTITDALEKVTSYLPAEAPRPSVDTFLSTDTINKYGAELQEWVHWQTHDPEEIVELTIVGLTAKEAEEVLKNYGKSKTTGKGVMVHKTARKELGTKSKPLVVWPFESSSMQVNNEPILYKTQLNEDGSLSCNCAGWCMGSAKNPSGRFCKHTKAIEAEAALLYKEWKKTGTIKGENFEVVSAEKVSTASSKSLYKALKEQPTAAEDTMFKAKRIVEI